MDITINIGGGIQDYIDIEDLQRQIASDVQSQIRYAVSGMINHDYELKQSIQSALAIKVASTVLPQELQDAIAKRIMKEVESAEAATVEYSWGLYDKAKEVLESRQEDIVATMQPKIDAAIELTTVGNYEIKGLLQGVIVNAIKEKKFDWKVDEIVTNFIGEHLEQYLNEKENEG